MARSRFIVGVTPCYEVRAAIAADLSALRRIHRAAFEDFVLRVDGEQSDEWWRAEFDDDYAQGGMSVILVGGDVVGVLDLRLTDDSVDISLIALAPAYQRVGIGTQVTRDVMTSAPRVTLRVRKGNEARVWYERLGFRVVREDKVRWHMAYP